MASGRKWIKAGAFEERNSMIRSKLVRGITEDEFIENFDEIMEFKGFMLFVPYNPETNSLASLRRVGMPGCLERMHRMNPTANKWADINNLSDNLRVFLKLRNEEI